MSAAATIREALIRRREAAALAALTELEADRDYALDREAGTADALQEMRADRDRLQAENKRLAEAHHEVTEDWLRKKDERDRCREALTDLAALERPADLMRQIARAALATPDTPPQHNHRTRDIKEPGICPKCDANRDAPDTPPDA